MRPAALAAALHVLRTHVGLTVARHIHPETPVRKRMSGLVIILRKHTDNCIRGMGCRGIFAFRVKTDPTRTVPILLLHIPHSSGSIHLQGFNGTGIGIAVVLHAVSLAGVGEILHVRKAPRRPGGIAAA